MFLKQLISGLLILGLCFTIQAQGERKFVRSGNEAYEQGNYEEAAESYRKGIEENAYSYEANFNLGGALYQQGAFESAGKQFDLLRQPGMDKEKLAKVYHNLGNTFMEQEQYREAIEAYKEALRNNPADEDTRYNLIYAKEKLKEQEQQQQQQDQQNQENQEEQQEQEQNQDQNQEQEDQEEKQQQEQENQQQEQQENQQQQQQEQNQNQEQQQQQGQQGEQKDEISRKEAERILQALQLDEKQLHDQMKKKKIKGQRVRIVKDW